jgi:hypothetical protein
VTTTLAIDVMIEFIIDFGHVLVEKSEPDVNIGFHHPRYQSGKSEPVTEGSLSENDATTIK